MGLENGVPSTPTNVQEEMFGSILRRLDQLERRPMFTTRYGTGAPTANDGNDGDTWIDTATKYLYGPKGAVSVGAWSSVVTALANVGTDGLGQSYVPFVYQNVQVSHTGNSGRYLKIGRWVIGSWLLAITGTGSSTYAWAVTMPTVSQFAGNLMGGFGYHYDASAPAGFQNRPFQLLLNSTTLMTGMISYDANGGFDGTTLGNGDTLNYVMIYAGTT